MGKSKKPKANLKSVKYSSILETDQALNLIAKTRTGGSINVRGLGFQLYYSCFRLLDNISTNNTSTRLEGIEDIDVIQIDNAEFIQLKSSVNKVDASMFWNMKVLQNFLPIYKATPDTNLRVVHNFDIAKGGLHNLVVGTKKDWNSWVEKIKNLDQSMSEDDCMDFLSKIVFEKIDLFTLQNNCTKLLIQHFDVNEGTESQYLKAIFHNAFHWAEKRSLVTSKDVKSLIQSVTDSFSKAPINLAIKNGWISEVKFQVGNNSTSKAFFDGKSAKPEHIALDLPVPRKLWEEKIMKAIQTFSIAVIKSSSGQGKSTLAWVNAKSLLDSGFSVYELKYCPEPDQVSSLVDFLKARLMIGQVPIIVVDGLNTNVAAWRHLAEQIYNLPVRILVTTREEDWYKYGVDASNVSLQIINIYLSIDEASTLFKQLKKQCKLHSSIVTWQPSWERIKDRGLLIEYIYLLTKGQLIEERIGEQVKNLNQDRDASAKLEILRLVSLADVLNITLNGTALTKHIQDSIGFESDRGEVLKQLEKEYYIRLDTHFVEGLHAVRSKHLMEALHQTLPIEESLLTLFSLIESRYVYDFFSSIPAFTTSYGKADLYNSLAELISDREFSQMVYAIDGMMHSETITYWHSNQHILNRIANDGTIDLFIYETFPFSSPNPLQSMYEILKDKMSNYDFLANNRDQLTPFVITNSDIVLFVRNLSKHLHDKVHSPKKFEGIGFLAKWFHQLEIKFPILLHHTEEELLEIIIQGEINETTELFQYLEITTPDLLRDFISKHKQTILSVLKKGTESISIVEVGRDIKIEYLLDQNEDKANDLSVHRINMIHSLLPIYERYCTQAIILPFPNKEIYKVVLQNSHKQMPKDNITNLFSVHINQIWSNTILRKYYFTSAYEWQEQHVGIRKEALKFSKNAVRFLETYIEVKDSRRKSAAQILVEQMKKLSSAFRHIKRYPNYSNSYLAEDQFKTEQATVSKWVTSLNNFLNQFDGLIKPKSENDRNLAIINLKDSISMIDEVQNAYNQITNNHRYFIFDNVVLQEKYWYQRLLKTASYYIHQEVDKVKKVPIAKTAVEAWYSKVQKNRLSRLNEILQNFEEISSYQFHLPIEIDEEESLSRVVIGIDRIELDNSDEEILYILEGLVDLADTDIDTFDFVNVHNNVAIGAFRVVTSFFQRLKDFQSGGELVESDYGNPIPLIPNAELIKTLDGVTIKLVKNEQLNIDYVKTVFAIWKLSEYRNRLDTTSAIEAKWLTEVEVEYSNEIKERTELFQPLFDKEDYQNFKNLVNQVLAEGYTPSQEELIKHLLERIQKINRDIVNY